MIKLQTFIVRIASRLREAFQKNKMKRCHPVVIAIIKAIRRPILVQQSNKWQKLIYNKDANIRSKSSLTSERSISEHKNEKMSGGGGGGGLLNIKMGMGANRIHRPLHLFRHD